MKARHYTTRDDQDDWLREQAYKTKTSKSALVRLAVDLLQARVTAGMALDQQLAQQENGS